MGQPEKYGGSMRCLDVVKVATCPERFRVREWRDGQWCWAVGLSELTVEEAVDVLVLKYLSVPRAHGMIDEACAQFEIGNAGAA